MIKQFLHSNDKNKKIDETLVKQACLHRIMKEIPHNQPDVLAKHIHHCLGLYNKVIEKNPPPSDK